MPPESPAEEPQPAQHARTRTLVFQGVLVAGGVLTFLFLLVELRDFLTPLLLAAAGAVLVWPLREQHVVRSLLLAGGLLVLLWLFSTLGNVLLPFVAVYLLAYLLDPAVGWAERRWRLPRWAGSLVLTLDLLEERGVARCRGSRIARRVRGLLGGDLLPGTPLGLLDARGKPCTSTPCREHREGNGEDQQQDGHGRNGGQGSFQPPVCTVVEYGDSDDGGVARSTPRGDARCRTLAALAFEPRRQAQSFPGGARSDARTTRAIGPRIDPTYRSRSVPRTAGSFHRSSV